MPFQNGLRACNREVLLSDRNVDTDEIFALLVNDGVNSNSRLTCLAVTNDEFALATSDGDHAIDSLQTCLYWRIDRLAQNDARSNALDRAALVRNDGAFIVQWFTERVHYAADQCIANGYLDDAPGGTRLVVFFDVCIIAQDSAANRLLFKVEGHAHQPGASKFYQLEIFHILQAIDAGDAILYRDHGADTGRRCANFAKACDVFFYDGTDFISPRCHRC